VIGLLASYALLRNRSRFIGIVALIALAALSLFNVQFLAHASLPIRPNFSYPQNLPDLIGAKPDERFITVGSRIFRHNTNLVYGLSNVQSYNPLLPKYFVEFMEACGAQTNDRFSQIFSPIISNNIDLTGAKTIISAQPLLDEDAAAQDISRGNASYANGLKLSKIKLLQDNKAIFCSLTADPNFSTTENCNLFLEVKEAKGKQYALGDPQSIASWRLNQSLVFSGEAPDNQKDWLLSAKLISDKDQKLVSLTKTTLGHLEADGSWTITTNKSKPFTKVVSYRFKPKSSFHDIITYENLTALNRYFFVSNIIWVQDKQQALKLLNTSGKSLRNTAVMEDCQKKEFEDLHGKLGSSNIFDTSGTVEKMNASDKVNYFSASSTVVLNTKTQNPALLIISDLFYPGWKAFIDGKECPIFRADCLFRAVLIPAGKHQILFAYYPLSFGIGAALFVITIIALSLMWIKLRK
jgi:hypothetical protein